ncbi:MAG: 4Fe-4S dicluster domain-containing protein [Actinomycetia bacterium]|nr:4Fe-4S dicluster domain-containing protein [Actinomycetes bacterium]
MNMNLLVTPRLCINCGTCESVCDQVAVDVFTFEDDDVSVSVPIMCMQCEDAACLDVCPANALYRDDNSTVLVDSVKCIGCKLCVNACPFGNIEYNYSSKQIVKCDLCDGAPDCAKYCPTRAIEYVSATDSNLAKKNALAMKFKDIFELE